MKNYKNFLLESVVNKTIKYYMLDWDDNILIMRTVIHVDNKINGEWQPIDVSTVQFREIRQKMVEDGDWRYRNDDANQTYSEFRDTGPRGGNAFYDDALKSIRTNDFGPVWDTFLECLIDGSIFMIITARGHEPKSIEKVVKWIIKNKLSQLEKETMYDNLRKYNNLFNINDEKWPNQQLIDNYLNNCDFIGINSKFFAKKHGEYDPSSPEQGKELGIKDFVKKVNKFGKEISRRVSVGFSDDDLSTVEHIYSYMKNELSLRYSIDFSVFHTADGINKLEF